MNKLKEENPVKLPSSIPLRPARKPQEDVPQTRVEREALRKALTEFIATENIVPPVPFEDLKVLADRFIANSEFSEQYRDFSATIMNNLVWEDELAKVPFDRRLLLLPVCLRHESKCTATFDEFGLLCKKCGLCCIQDLIEESEKLGYVVLVAEGTPLVMQLIETGKIEAIVGVSCLNVLERVFPYMESAAVPGIAIPLLQDDCKDTNIDLTWLMDVIHLTAEDKTYRLNLNELRDDVRDWFSADSLEKIMDDDASNPTAVIARDWMAKTGKRWRPFISAAMYMAAQTNNEDGEFPEDFLKAAVAVECFHKASLIHDDIEDNDAIRYGEKTLHEEYGIPVALNVGDYLLGEGYRLLADCDISAEQKVKMLHAAAMGHRSLSSGQGAELIWANDPKPMDPKEVIHIFREKTAPAFEVALRIGSVYAGNEESIWEFIAKYSEALGIAYQISDDLDDIFGSIDSNDASDMRPSLLLALAHQKAKGDDKELMRKLWTKEIAYVDFSTDIERILSDLEIEKRARELRDAFIEEAIRSLSSLDNPSIKGLLRRIITKILDDNEVEAFCHESKPGNVAGSGISAATT
ncbi:MAG: polyprenyl synthetase family protein [Lentisphaeria bacterium]|nr:polyprenyl synthetase family protein [Lentisphaeria bacterium]NQZ67890.1 polyprenyl synthetase family protein [Lentisphaeria bacterium]